MTREQFFAEFRHDWAGMVVDALTFRGQHADVGMKVAALLEKIDTRLNRMYDALQPQAIGKPPPAPPPQQTPANGNHGEPQQRRAASGGMTGILSQG